VIEIRRAADRGHADHGWLRTWHSFSFAGYDDPAHRGFRSLRVINDDWIAPGGGFPTHPHRDMEILTYVLDGAVAHQDSAGHETVVAAGQIQRMSAGAGIRHSERNASAVDPLRLLQIWILPRSRGGRPGYETKDLPEAGRDGLALIASPDGEGASLRLLQDARVWAGRLGDGRQWVHPLAPGRGAWLQVARGSVALDGVELLEGDGVAVTDEAEVRIRGIQGAELLLFDLGADPLAAAS